MKDKLGNLLNPEERSEDEMREREKKMKETLNSNPTANDTIKKQQPKKSEEVTAKKEDVKKSPKKEEVKTSLIKRKTPKMNEPKKVVEDVVEEDYGDGGFDS